jgi:hypothetical protein
MHRRAARSSAEADTQRGVDHGLACCGAGAGRYHLSGGGAALCGFEYLQAGYGVPGVDRQGTLSADGMGEGGVEHRPVPAFTGPGPGRVPGVQAAPPLARHHAPRVAGRRSGQRRMEEPAALAVPDQADPHRPDPLHLPPPKAAVQQPR